MVRTCSKDEIFSILSTMTTTSTLPIDYAARALAVLISSRYFSSLFNTQKGNILRFYAPSPSTA